MAGSGRPSKGREKSPSSTPVPSTEQQDGSRLPEAEWDAMSTVLNAIYDYRTEDGFDPSKLFHRKVNKRVIPEYYDTIKEPMAMSTIKQKIHTKAYQTFSDFVRDFALIPYNAQVFNVPDSGAFQDALVIKEQLEKQLQLLVKDGLITQEVATLPDLGEIPTYENVPLEDGDAGADDDDDSDEEGEEDDEDEGDEDEDGKRKKRRGGRSGGSAAKREAAGEEDGKRSRGRPPKLHTPMEARMQAVLRGIRKPKNNRGQLMIKDFDRLPDKAAMPEYYAEIKAPMAYDQLKRKAKRKKYRTLEDFMADVNLMFNNAKMYNTDDSQIYKDAVALQVEAGRLYDEEKAKPDDIFADEDGKIPMPNGVLHNGELYKVGDWIHIQNPNDLTKPIPAQIYRTYRSPGGQSMVNVCWYYRPEQTVHRFDKHFLNNEVVKTGRYRDHSIDEVEGKCFIMFYTRYFKGRPRGLPEGTEIYVCQARYNEVAHQFNTIKTWASCLPDEVRDKDYEMDIFDYFRKMKKFPSPILYMLKDDQKETDDFPKVQWGADGAPPKVGAVHRKTRTEKDSPPPEPTPPPPPKMPTPPPRQIPPPQTYAPATAPQTLPKPPSTGVSSGFTPARLPQYPPQPTHTSAPPRPPSSQAIAHAPSTPQPPSQAPSRPPLPVYQSSGHGLAQSTPAAQPPRPTTNYREPPPIEVYTLPTQANFSLPLEIREQYQRDEFGNVLFFTTPPITVDQKGDKLRGHSVRYLAERSRRADMLSKKRKEREVQKQATERALKKARPEADQRVAAQIEEVKRKALQALDRQLATAVVGELGDEELKNLTAAQKSSMEQNQLRTVNERKRAESRAVQLNGNYFADDWDARLTS